MQNLVSLASRSSRWRSMPDVLLILALFASSFFFFGDALLPPEGQMLTGNDLYAFHYPMEDFAFRAYREGQLPLW